MWLVLQISTCSVVTLITAVVLCSCWKRKRQKDDWLGLDGMVTQKNPDENVNHLPSAALQTPQLASVIVVTAAAVVDECDYAKRPAIVSNTRRSLPDIPLEGQVRGDVVYETNDNLSELYATVESYHNPAKRHTLPNGIDSRPSVSQHSSMSQADDAFSPYASVNYDKLNKLEHPYAIVKPPGNTESNEIMEEPTVRTSLLANECGNNLVPSSDPHPPPRSRRGSAQSNAPADINAATAVAGGIAASQELPYMTPPIGPSSQPNFSGDSQDSSKGYTSISVREPLSNIIAQTKELNKTKRSLDPHYSTVSDDSDEMYTTIPDPTNNQEYTSGSETYAQIQPVSLTVAAEVNPVPSPLAVTTTNTSPADPIETIEASDSAPQPPSVDSLKNISHSRQASSSSSILNLGSPKPEKRQANSPLPPPPSATSPDFLNVDKLKNLDEMYAKVYKNKKRGADEEKIDIVPPDEKETDKKIGREHNYETLKKSPRKNSDPGYEKLKLKDECDGAGEPGYARIGPESLDPGYEIVDNHDDPNYERLNDRYAETLLGYSVVNKLKTKEEPNYETMPDPCYDQNDPNYESVKYLDMEITDSSNSSQPENTGYETLESNSSGDKASAEDPPYEKFDGSESGSAGYEKIKHGNDYETVKTRDGTSSEDGEDEIFQV